MTSRRGANLSAGRKGMNIARARELRAQGMKQVEIGRQLAAEAGRSMPYQATSVARALAHATRRDRDYADYLAAEAVHGLAKDR